MSQFYAAVQDLITKYRTTQSKHGCHWWTLMHLDTAYPTALSIYGQRGPPCWRAQSLQRTKRVYNPWKWNNGTCERIRQGKGSSWEKVARSLNARHCQHIRCTGICCCNTSIAIGLHVPADDRTVDLDVLLSRVGH